MKRISLIIAFSLFLYRSHCQSFEWIQAEKTKYSFNPGNIENPLAYDGVSVRVVDARTDSIAQVFGQSAYGTTFIESRDTAGQLIWSLPLGDMVSVNKISTDQNGAVYFGGSFQGVLHLGANDSLDFINGTVSGFNTFIVKLDIQGNVIWKRNLAPDYVNYERIDALAVSPSNVCWYAITDFFLTHIVSLDASGNDVSPLTIENGKTIGNISFDPWGGMYVSGGTQSGNFIMNTDTFNAPYQYNMFIARFNPQGQPSWAKFGADITFQRPVVVADQSGNAFYFGTRYDSISFDNLYFTIPFAFGDFFGFKTDTSGAMYWKLQQPPLLIGPFGTFEPATNMSVGADASGNYYLAGIQGGTVDWGNGFISSTTAFNDRKIAVVCINSAGNVQWEKMRGSNILNYTHAIAVSMGGDCYFSGNFRDTAAFDSIIVNTVNENNFLIGKISNIPTSLSEDNDDGNYILYPNPSSGELIIPETLIGAQLLIFDIAGRIVYSNSGVRFTTIDLSGISSGSYTIQIKSGNNIINKKWIRMN